MKVYIVGIGMDGKNTLTHEAYEVIEGSELIIGAKRMLEPFESSGKPCVCSYKAEEIAEVIRTCGKSTVSVLMSGDCGFYSGAKGLADKFRQIPEIEDYDIICGISTPVYLSCKLGLPWEKMKFVSLHGKSGNIAVNVLENEYCFFLLGGKVTPAEICKRLCEYELGNVRVNVGENLGYENEIITSGTAEILQEIKTDNLCAVITENKNYLKYIPSGISDDDFIRTKIPMTKSEVRVVSVSGLNVRSDGIYWDIGCGTGSVSVETAMRCPDGMVYSFDKNSEAVGLTCKNSRKFSCDNIKVYEGICPEILEEIPSPDGVFIGGSSGNMKDIFRCVQSKNPNARIVVNAVSLETLNQTAQAFESFGAECEITQLAVTRTRKIGSHTMLNAQNPIFIISGELK